MGKKKKTSSKPEDMTMGKDMKYNKTGIATAPNLSKTMAEGAVEHATRVPRGERAETIRAAYNKEAQPIGSVPPPASVKGAFEAAKGWIQGEKPTVFIDKIAERLAFERTGTRLYEALIGKLDAQGGFSGGPTEAELRRIRDEELQHFHLLEGCLRELGADPTAVTPSADLVAVESMGIGQVLGDPRTTVAQGLHAILVAELTDKEGWELLIRLAAGLGFTEMAEKFRAADREEEQHLTAVRRWVAAHAESEAGAKRAA